MNTDYSEYYTGTQKLEPIMPTRAWRGNVEVTPEPFDMPADTLVSYDLSRAEDIGFEDINNISDRYKEQGVIVEFSAGNSGKAGLFGKDWAANLERQLQQWNTPEEWRKAIMISAIFLQS